MIQFIPVDKIQILKGGCNFQLWFISFPNSNLTSRANNWEKNIQN